MDVKIIIGHLTPRALNFAAFLREKDGLEKDDLSNSNRLIE